jgi:hypothetical protein
MRKILLVACLALAACGSIMSNEGAYSVDTTVYTLLTGEKVVLTRPCTATVTNVCVDKQLAQTLKDARLIMMQALVNYQLARDSYLVNTASGATPSDAAVSAAFASLQDAIKNAKSILALDTVKAILSQLDGSLLKQIEAIQ